MLQRMDDDIVGFDRIGDCGYGAVRRGDVLRQIVDHPVRDILDTGMRSLSATASFPGVNGLFGGLGGARIDARHDLFGHQDH
jgi:hypothetical protein